MRGLSVDASNGRGDAFNCLIAGNVRSGVAYWRGPGGFLEGNLIGVDFGGAPRANGASGIYVAAGLVASWYNAIEYNKDFGAAVSLSGAAFYSQSDYIALNGGIAIDWGLDGPTAFDAGGLMPPVPRLFAASYDPARRRTIVTGVIPMDARTPRDSYQVVATLAARDFDGGIAKGASEIMRGNGSDLPFRIEIPGDLRGQTITVRSARIVYSDNPAGDSEFSAGVVVR